MIGFESFGWKISLIWNPDLVTFKICDRDIVYINELLEKRRSHGMNYFGKDKKLKSSFFFFFFFFFFEKKFTYETNTGKYWKMFFRNFFSEMQPNTVKYFTAKQTNP
jgi:hypothetical protein